MKGLPHILWYNCDIDCRMFSKFTITGSSYTADPSQTKNCEQIVVIDAPGMTPSIAGHPVEMRHKCLDSSTIYPLKIYTTQQRIFDDYVPIDGVIKNIAFTNTVNNETINTIC